ncbi:hypothetical protein, conserved [Eimeria tenella]|uniref:Uncharacterized protein n=1 Tax=Eimeria tenella TaxID=5802 RepID=U6KPQ7_EIMTE|nr:hypothetical protein, conserved [Eimeria tenella]CDJ39926.1 hypothetical protein, conserved [Eimeria tenella]|eukprot:XP_013230679.1 hypothetical protein, conserved [Eimeria tenella]
MGHAGVESDSNDSHANTTNLPVWLMLQRCRGFGWMHGRQWGCFGLIDSGRNAAVFSRVVLVAGDESQSSDSADASPASKKYTGTASSSGGFAASRRGHAEAGDDVLRILDNVAPVEVEAAPGDWNEGEGWEEPASMFAALLPSSAPTERNSIETKAIEGEFTVMHRVKEDPPLGEDGEELQICFGEMLWHPTPPLLIACRSLWAAPQRMRLTKSAGESGHEPQADGESAAPAAAAAPVLVLSDIEEDEPVSQSTDSKALPSVVGVSRAVAQTLRATLSDREALSRMASDTVSVSLQSLRQMPSTLSRLSSATSEVFHRAASDWATFGNAALQAAADSAERAQRVWRTFRGKGNKADANKEGDNNT